MQERVVLTHDPAWKADGACKGEDPDLFFPARGEPNEVARELCRICPVQSQCLDWALKHEKFGVWGGTSEKQRRRMRRTAGIRMQSVDIDPDEIALVVGMAPVETPDPFEEKRMTVVNVNVLGEATYIRDEVLEQLLERRCDTWEFVPELRLDTLDMGASLANQARLEPVNEEAVDRYAADMERGDVFPPILVHRRKTRRGEKLVILGGNHRTAAAKKAKRHHLAAYIVEASSDAVLRLMYEDNRRHGLPPTDEERVMAAQHLMAMGDSLPEAAAAVGIGKAKLTVALETAEADRRAAPLALNGWKKLAPSARWRLGQIHHGRVFEKAVRLAVKAQLKTNEAYDLVTLLNDAATPEEALDRLEDHRSLLGLRAKGHEEKAGAANNARRRFISALQEIRLIDPSDVLSALETVDQRAVLGDQFKATAKVLQSVMEGL